MNSKGFPNCLTKRGKYRTDWDAGTTPSNRKGPAQNGMYYKPTNSNRINSHYYYYKLILITTDL